MGLPGPLARVRTNITDVVGLVFVALTVIGLFTQTWLFVVGLVCLFVGTPLVALLFGDRDDIAEWWGEEKAERLETAPDQREGEDKDPLEELKRRYALGDLSEAEFEQRVQQLLDVDETNTETSRSRTAQQQGSSDRDSETEYA